MGKGEAVQLFLRSMRKKPSLSIDAMRIEISKSYLMIDRRPVGKQQRNDSEGGVFLGLSKE